MGRISKFMKKITKDGIFRLPFVLTFIHLTKIYIEVHFLLIDHDRNVSINVSKL